MYYTTIECINIFSIYKHNCTIYNFNGILYIVFLCMIVLGLTVPILFPGLALSSVQ